MSDSDLESAATELANKAVTADKANNFEEAAFYYIEAAEAFLSASFVMPDKSPSYIEISRKYIDRASHLKKQASETTQPVTAVGKSADELTLERCHFLISHAMDEDEAGNPEEAIVLYTEAIEACLKISNGCSDEALKLRLNKLAAQALDRAEDLKRRNSTTTSRSPVTASQRDTDRTTATTTGAGSQAARGGGAAAGGRQSHRQIVVGAADYSREEIAVLKRTSKINSREFVPFLPSDLHERFAFSLPFTDKDGLLALSAKQRREFGSWMRPSDLWSDPKMIMVISSFSIKQTIVSDCSFVASLAISAQYERRFQKKIITRIIYPQKRNGEPVYNPSGKYMIQLHINGVLRKVLIDDQLPVARDGQLLCSFSTNRGELWVSLLEKAYLKVMGGYDFPGSNSNNDLYALTGWIPDRIAIKPQHQTFNAAAEYKKLKERFHRGHCLVTVATGELSEAEADRAGLVPTHAYAVLDIREYKGTKLLMLKNPWSHLRWKGNFSEFDRIHWTPEFRSYFNFDPETAKSFDNGVFWIDYDSLIRFFDVFYVNWNPDMFTYVTTKHTTWSARAGPAKDAYNISDNPQYRLDIRAGHDGAAAVWVLLSRHITDKDDFANNREFITVLVYNTGGKRVYYPYDPAPYKDGVRINSPHYLCKLAGETGARSYTLVVSQYEKHQTIHYSLRVFSTCPFTLTAIRDPYLAAYDIQQLTVQQKTGQWRDVTAGGCANYRDTFLNNPLYQLSVEGTSNNNEVLVELRGPKEYSVGFEVITVTENVPNAPGAFKRSDSGAYRRGYCMLELSGVSAGLYNIRPTTFRPGEEGAFIIDVSANCPVRLSLMQR